MTAIEHPSNESERPDEGLGTAPGMKTPGAKSPTKTILQLGFGSGAEFIRQWSRWTEDPNRSESLHFVGIDKQLTPAPVPSEDSARVEASQLTRPTERIEQQAVPDAPKGDACLDRSEQLRQQWPIALPGLHRLSFESGRVTLTLAIGEPLRMLSRLAAAFDTVLLGCEGDQRRMLATLCSHEQALSLAKRVARLANPDAILSAHFQASEHDHARAFLKAIGDVGFVQIEPSETESAADCKPKQADVPLDLHARYQPRWQTPTLAQRLPKQLSRVKRQAAIVIGAGLAGCAMTHSLTRRGWEVELFEQAAGLASGGSGQPAIADHLHVSPDDNVLARLSRAALLLASGSEPVQGVQQTGRLQLVQVETGRKRLHAASSSLDWVHQLGWPDQFIHAIDSSQASQIAGIGLHDPAIWMPMCRMAQPALLCDHWLRAAGNLVQLHLRTRVARIERHREEWFAFDDADHTLAQAPILVLANAGAATRLAGLPDSLLRAIRGQSTRLPAALIGPVRCVIGGDAYVCPLPGDQLLIGSSFDDETALNPNRAADLSNLRRFLRQIEPSQEAETLNGQERSTIDQPPPVHSEDEPPRMGLREAQTSGMDPTDAMARRLLEDASPGAVGLRFVARDRLPLIGRIPDLEIATTQAGTLARNAKLPIPTKPGLYGAFGFGSRGLLWSSLAAEVIAAEVTGEPAPIESDLLLAIDPARFVRQQLRRSRLSEG